MTTVLSDNGGFEFAEAHAAGDDLWLPAAALEQATGWAMKPEGLCRGPVCIPVPPAEVERYVSSDRVNAAAFWRRLDKPVLASEAGDAWVLGESAGERQAALQSLQAPDFALPDLDGRMHRLSDHRGRKVLLATWASW